jgi:ParB-like chromosome segregation protein Spo0J
VDGEIIWLEIDRVQDGPSPRLHGLDEAHVVALAELEGRWPPIVVARADARVIDGHHRVAAARRIGHSRISAVLCDVEGPGGFVEAVRRNIEHGLPLTMDDRREAARQVLRWEVDWSDRAIAAVCGLSPRTVGRLRAASDSSVSASDRRVGRDGRIRLVRPESNRLRIAEAVRAHPDDSLRSIARRVGTSAETVRRVRQSLEQPEGDARRSPRRRERSDTAEIVALGPLVEPVARLRLTSMADPAVISTTTGKQFASWFETTDPGDDWHGNVGAVPLSRVYEVADQARRRARVWSEFATALENRTRSRTAEN